MLFMCLFPSLSRKSGTKTQIPPSRVHHQVAIAVHMLSSITLLRKAAQGHITKFGHISHSCAKKHHR